MLIVFILITTFLILQGNHRYVVQSADTHHSYFASPRIDLNPRLVFSNILNLYKSTLNYFEKFT